MTRHYCSLWDRAYCPKGLVMHESLLEHSSEDFVLHILAMDRETTALLFDMKLENAEVMPLRDFEYSMHMEPVRASRTWQEYCWTAASNLMEWLMPWVEGGITYLDADLMFFSDPKVIFEEMGERSIAITPHRYMTKDLFRLQVNGQFNVGVVVARNTDAGRRCIKKWAAQTREWCFYRVEDGKFGDQKYLDTWANDYPGEVAVLDHVGVNVGPWSVRNFDVHERVRRASINTEEVTRKVFVGNQELVAYHYHEFRDEQHFTNWPLRDCDIELIYKPYVAAWTAANERIRQVEARAAEEMQRLAMQAGRA